METNPNLIPTPTIEVRENGDMTVWINWPADLVDRPCCAGIGINGASRKLAERLCRAITDGVALGTPEICTDVNGKTYVHASHNVRARCLNADLRAIGY